MYTFNLGNKQGADINFQGNLVKMSGFAEIFGRHKQHLALPPKGRHMYILYGTVLYIIHGCWSCHCEITSVRRTNMLFKCCQFFQWMLAGPNMVWPWQRCRRIRTCAKCLEPVCIRQQEVRCAATLWPWAPCLQTTSFCCWNSTCGQCHFCR